MIVIVQRVKRNSMIKQLVHYISMVWRLSRVVCARMVRGPGRLFGGQVILLVNRLGPHPIHPLTHWSPDFFDSQDISDYSRFKMRLNICRSKVWAPEMRRHEVGDMKEGQARKSRYRWTGRKTPSADSVSASLVFSRLPCHWKRAGFAFHSWHKML